MKKPGTPRLGVGKSGPTKTVEVHCNCGLFQRPFYECPTGACRPIEVVPRQRRRREAGVVEYSVCTDARALA